MHTPTSSLVRVVPTTRDIRILAEVHRFRTVTSEHLAALVFPGVGARTVQERLRRLALAGYLDRRYFVAALYHALGANAFPQLNGMFSIALVDRNRLFLVRDRLGVKPLYYRTYDKGIAFASEAKALACALGPWAPPLEYAEFEVLLDGRTLFDEVREVPPGAILEFDGAQCRIERYWRLGAQARFLRRQEFATACGELRHLMEDAVRIRRPAEPFGVSVSGGIDSAIIACLARPDFIYTSVSSVGGLVVNSVISRYATAELTVGAGVQGAVIRSEDFATEERFQDAASVDSGGPLALLKAVIRFRAPTFGFRLRTFVDVPPGCGLGSSAALAVAVLRVLDSVSSGAHFEVSRLVADALFVENELLQNINGGQDQYASVLGGWNAFTFSGSRVERHAISVAPTMVREIEGRSILCFSGASHVSGSVLAGVMYAYTKGTKSTCDALRQIKEAAGGVARALETSSLSDFVGELNRVLDGQRRMHDGVITPAIDEIVNIARAQGHCGAKAAGAGGGGFVYICCLDESVEPTRAALKQAGYDIYDVRFATQGVTGPEENGCS